MKILVLGLGACALVWIGLQHWNTPPRGKTDAGVNYEIGLCMLFAVLIMLIWTRHWTTRNTGMVLIYSALAGNVAFNLAYYHWQHIPSDTVVNVITAGYIVGGAMFLLGISYYVYRHWQDNGGDEPLTNGE